jgi:RNA polymerase sigma-70 factor (ECF subfamily)
MGKLVQTGLGPLARPSRPNIPVPTASPNSSGAGGEEFVCTFNEVRAEVLRMLYRILGNYEDAQDAIQDAFLKCWRGLETIKKVRNLRGWIFRVGANAAKDLQRYRRCRSVRPLPCAAQIADNGESPDESAANRENEHRLRTALLDLRPEEREVFLLRMKGCLTYGEIAKLRGCPVGTIKSQMRAAIIKLRRVLRER